MSTNNRHPSTAPPPCLSLDDSFLMASPGPMTLVSNFFSADSFDYRSFSELLAGAMASPLAGDDGDGGGSHKNVVNGSGFKQSRPMNLVVARSPVFTVPPGLSPSCFLNSPTFCFSPQSPFGMSHQQALAQVTAQAVLTQPHMQMQAAPNFTLNDASGQNVAPSEPITAQPEPSEISNAEKKYQLSCLVIDKPADDGYNWRKYGQKHVKGSDYPRSYYKCTHLNCTVKKKVERGAADIGHITEIIYKGQHNHEKPQGNHKRVRDYDNDSNEIASIQAKSESNSQGWFGNSNKLGESFSDCSLPEADSEDMGDVDIREEEGGDSEPDPKRRNTDLGVSGGTLTHKTVTEAKIIVQTRSQVDLLDDGYRWRKYGQKVVKGNSHPRSYYKCTSVGCNVRKHVERASMDPKAVVTTYEGKHNHDVPAARNSSHNTGTSNSISLKPHKVVPEKHSLLEDMDFGNNSQRPVQLCLKEEQIIA